MAGFVPGDEDDRFAARIEDEQHPDFGGAWYAGAKLLEVMQDAREVDAIDQWSTELWSLHLQFIQRLCDLVCRSRVVLADVGGTNGSPRRAA